MKLTFEHPVGIVRTLYKHSAITKALRAGQITEAVAASKPWYLRLTVEGKEKLFVLPANPKDAERAAKDLIKGQLTKPEAFTEFLRQKEAQRSLTLGTLAADWLAAGCPFNAVDQRRPAATATVRENLQRALPWWTDKPVATINHQTFEHYAAHRAPALRSVDLELSALSCLCQWAVFTSRITTNPFAKRRRFRKSEDVVHCHTKAPKTDEQFHQILGWLWSPEKTAYIQSNREQRTGQLDPYRFARHTHDWQQDVIAGGWFAMQALTGLRPGEIRFLQRTPPLDKSPTDLESLMPGTVYPDRIGQIRMKVQRLKRGQNPFVLLVPAAIEFLSAWRAWLAATQPDSTALFPLVTSDQTTLNRCLNRAVVALGLHHITPHGFRAFHTKVLRSDDLDDNTISSRLGQSTNGKLIRSTYGNPNDSLGGAQFDFLPEDTAPAWNLLQSCYGKTAASSGKMRQDTAATPTEPDQEVVICPATEPQQPPA